MLAKDKYFIQFYQGVLHKCIAYGIIQAYLLLNFFRHLFIWLRLILESK